MGNITHLFKWSGIVCFLMILCSTLVAQPRYTIYRSNGDVKIMRFRTTTWNNVSRNDSISLFDHIGIGDGASVAILDSKTRKIYKSSSKGKKLVKFWIEEANRAADNITSNMNKEILSELREQNTSAKEYTRIAAAMRGTASDNFVDSLLRATFGVLHQTQNTSNSTTGITYAIYPDGYFPSDSFVLTKTTANDGMYWLSIENKNAVEAFVNVLRVATDGTWSLCYEFDYSSDVEYLLVPGESKIELKQYLFADGETGESLILLVTDRPYDTHALQMMLK